MEFLVYLAHRFTISKVLHTLKSLIYPKFSLTLKIVYIAETVFLYFFFFEKPEFFIIIMFPVLG
jgi:hypothetical protein